MDPLKENWELTILDADPLIPMRNFHSLAVGDLDGDGHQEMIIGGHGGLLWYRPDTFERGIISIGNDFSVGLSLEDIDGDGRLEVITSEGIFERSIWWITCFKAGEDLQKPWQRFVLDPCCTGLAHDIIFFDIDGDGRREMIANAVFCQLNGIFIYRPGDDEKEPWLRHTIVQNVHAEGLAAADLDGDGQVEIVNGPDWYKAPNDGPYTGLWHRNIYATDMREMCRAILTDITGNGLPDILLVESEYRDSKLAWYENRFRENPEMPFMEHEIGHGFVFAHSFDLWNKGAKDQTGFLLAEMAQGGWHQPYNYEARLLRYWTVDYGVSWKKEEIDRGSGTHQALVVDIDGDGELEIVGKECTHPRVQVWRRTDTPFPIRYQHRFVDRDKPYTSTDLIIADVDGDGNADILSGAWWYRYPSWERYEIPGIYQILTAYDLDGDGQEEFIAMLRSQVRSKNWYEGLSSQLVWIKPVDPRAGVWEQHGIGTGRGDWPHGTLVAPLLPGKNLALLAAYHSCWSNPDDFPEIFEIPQDPSESPWQNRTFAEIPFSENFLTADINCDGKIEVIAGLYWLQANPDGSYVPHRITDENIDIAQCAVADLNGDGLPDIILSDATADVVEGKPMSRLMWFENPGSPFNQPWKRHVIDLARYPHSIAIADLDEDGQVEIVCGEHDPAQPYRNHCRLFIYKPANQLGTAWKRLIIDDRFEHHCGVKLVKSSTGIAIASHGWGESRYVHLWEPQTLEKILS